MSKESGELGMKQPSLNKRIVGDNGWSRNSLSLLLYAFVLSVAFSALFSCTDMVPTKEVRLIDSLNGAAYAYRYRQLDSSCFFARQAYMKVNLYKSGKAEPVDIITGIRTASEVQAIRGLHIGDTIITSGTLQLRTGLAVTLDNID